jgi:hypothetical protein
MAAGAAGAAAAAAMQAIKASGVLVRVEPSTLLDILWRNPDALVVCASGGFFSTKYQYMTSYKGLAFHAISTAPLELPPKCEIVMAQSISIPG